jgi:hypothetical protein
VVTADSFGTEGRPTPRTRRTNAVKLIADPHYGCPSALEATTRRRTSTRTATDIEASSTGGRFDGWALCMTSNVRDTCRVCPPRPRVAMIVADDTGTHTHTQNKENEHG